jgi:Na+-transporting NADH:ubiquinone oxidoreductase subunit B
MKFLEELFESKKHVFEKGGKLEKLYPVFEMVDTFIFTPSDTTKTTSHVRDGIDLKRTMITVAMALFPVVLMALYNTGYQANLVISQGAQAEGWRASVMTAIGLGFDPNSFASNFVYGFLWFFPIFLVTQVAGGFWEVIFASVRKHEINEGFSNRSSFSFNFTSYNSIMAGGHWN